MQRARLASSAAGRRSLHSAAKRVRAGADRLQHDTGLQVEEAVMTRIDFLFRQYDTIRDWYKQAEDKAKFMLTLDALIVGGVNGLAFAGDGLRAFHPEHGDVVWLLLALAGLVLVASLLFVLRALWPRHHAHEDPLPRHERIWFFGDLAAMSQGEHAAAMAAWSDASVERALVAQNHILSVNVWRKNEALNIAIAACIAGLLLFFAAAVLGLGVLGSTAASPPARP